MDLKFEGTPLEYAQSVKPSELKKVIKAIKTASEYNEYADRCRVCFEKYLAGDMAAAGWWSHHAGFAK